jgi:hypothetical protein
MPDVTDRSWFANTATFERFRPFGRVRDNERSHGESAAAAAATPRPESWFAATHNRPTGQAGGTLGICPLASAHREERFEQDESDIDPDATR